MREGVNPEKNKEEINLKKQHRVVVVFYIPNIEEDYYTEALQVLDSCLHSLTKTINPETTNITLINNNSIKDSESVVNKYLDKIDKYVLYGQNKGKVYAVINEVRSVFEPFVTISDADVLFFNGWENAVFDVFKYHPKAGIVTPLPSQYSGLNFNSAVIFDSFFTHKLRYGKIVSDEDVDLYLKGINNEALVNNSFKFNWKERQFYLDGKVKAIIGATHFIATYKSNLFKNQSIYPEIKFKNGYEEKFMDCLAEERGLYRLSTVKSFAYHLGNRIDDEATKLNYDNLELIQPSVFETIHLKDKYISNHVLYFVKSLFLKVFKKHIKIKKGTADR